MFVSSNMQFDKTSRVNPLQSHVFLGAAMLLIILYIVSSRNRQQLGARIGDCVR